MRTTTPTTITTQEAVRFRVLLRLGSGGMGEVHLAEMHRGAAHEVVALKRIHRELLSDPEATGRFDREARICSLLSHPLVVGLRGHGTDADGPWIALEYVNGRSASQLVKASARRGLPLPLTTALAICHDMAEALHYAHTLKGPDGRAQPLLHRDISPDNVLVAYTGEAKLTDFGIARVMDSTQITRTGMVRGKLGFLGPEQLDGAHASIASDVFSLAATCYRILTGAHAFNGKTDVELIRAVLNAHPPPASSLRRELPSAVVDWLQSALSKAPAARPRDLAALAGLIRDALPDGIVEARKTVAGCMEDLFPSHSDPQRAEITSAMKQASGTREAPPPRPRRRRGPRRAALAVGAVLLAGASLGLGLVLGSSPMAALPEETLDQPDPIAAIPRGGDDGIASKPEPEPEPPLVETSTTSPPAPVVKPRPPRRESKVARDGKRPVKPKPAPVAVAVAVATTGTLLMKSDKEVVVFVNGEYLGPVPTSRELPPGEYTVLFSHLRLDQKHSRRVTLEPGKRLPVVHSFQPGN